MADKTVKTRDQIEEKYTWDIGAMYPDEGQVDKDIEAALQDAEEFSGFAGRLMESAETFLKAMKLNEHMWQLLENAYTYAHMKKDEDNRVDRYQAMLQRCETAIARCSALTAFFSPEIIAAPEGLVMGYVDSCSELEIYRHDMDSLLRQKEHILAPDQENIMAQLGEVLGAPHDIFNMFNDADAKFGTVKDEEGDEIELTHGNYIRLMECGDRQVRKNAFEHMYAQYKAHINTISTAYSYNVKTGVITSRIRGYSSARARALSGDNVPEEVYDNLIEQVHDALPALHRYMALRRKVMGLEELHLYDIMRPMIDIPDTKVSFEEAVEIINRALAPMGSEYLDAMNAGIEARWIDVFENEGKTSGAYSFGSYSSMPYILCNYQSTLKDVFTIIHEMGHSMHSWFTRRNQPFTYGDHSIFTAEVASTVNEALLMKHLIAEAESEDMKKYLLNMYIEEFRTTLFRQTMFAEFEHWAHRTVEEGGVLTPGLMNEKYGELNAMYFGPSVVNDEEIKYEWARIPHFYRAFYVYKYATGYSAATAISRKILEEGPAARDNYIEFLKSGSSDYPIELLKIAGVDMGTPGPVAEAMKTFTELVDEFSDLMV